MSVVLPAVSVGSTTVAHWSWATTAVKGAAAAWMMVLAASLRRADESVTADRVRLRD